MPYTSTDMHHPIKKAGMLANDFSNFRTALPLSSSKASRQGKTLVLCLLAPVFGAVFRKLVPGQPVSIEIGLASLGLILLLFTGLREKGGSYNSVPIILWILFSFVYLLPSLNYEPRIFGLGMVTRILPLFLPWAAAKCLKNTADFQLLCRSFTVFALLHIPIVIWSLIAGVDQLPSILRPLSDYSDLGKGTRAGFGEFVGFMITPSMLANTMLVSIFLSLAGLKIERKSLHKWYYLAIFTGLISMYLSTRRGAMYIGVGGIGLYAMLLSRSKIKTLFGVSIAIYFLLFVDNISRHEGSKDHESRIDHFIAGFETITERIDYYFIDLVLFWFNQYPLGSFLGSVGREARAFGLIDEYSPMVESGGPQLMAETGVLGFILFPAVILTMVFAQLSLKKSGNVRNPILILHTLTILYLMMFYFKEMLCLNTLSVPHLFFFAGFGICHSLMNMRQLGSRL
jgi:hypothetical protein